MKKFFLKEKPVMALVTIRRSRDEIYCSMISKKIDTTYAHTVKIVSKMEDGDLVESNKKGRKKILQLTPKGKEYSDQFLDILDAFKKEETDLNVKV
jgi:DNA-binding MarR family transcriptional regulator